MPAEDLVGVRGCDLDVTQGGPLTELEPRREVAQPYTIRNTNYSGEVYLSAEILIHDLTMAALKKEKKIPVAVGMKGKEKQKKKSMLGEKERWE